MIKIREVRLPVHPGFWGWPWGTRVFQGVEESSTILFVVDDLFGLKVYQAKNIDQGELYTSPWRNKIVHLPLRSSVEDALKKAGYSIQS